MGGKRRQASAILEAMGLEPRQHVDRIVLADAGPWGWVWPVLLDPELAPLVAEVLVGWASEDPRELWQRLAKERPPIDLAERTAGWLWLQARAASGAPVWWAEDEARWEAGRRTVVDGKEGPRKPGQSSYPQATVSGWRMASGERRPDQPIGQRGRWLASDGRGDARPAGQRGAKGCGGVMYTETVAARSRAVADVVARWLVLQAATFGGKPVIARNGRWVTSGYARSSADALNRNGSCWSIDRIVDRLPGPIDVGWSVFHGDVFSLDPIPGAFCYVDPPYVGKTGYGWDLERERVLALARRWSDAGCVVAISEAVPLDLEGWYHVDLGPCGRKGAGPEWLTMNRPPAAVPAQQQSLFSAHP